MSTVCRWLLTLALRADTSSLIRQGLIIAACLASVTDAATPSTTPSTISPHNTASSTPPPAYEIGALLNLTQYRQQHRRTLDGRLCAAAFVQQGQTFTDCTATKAPDGNTGTEWCYVEASLLGQGARDWDYCRPSIDYDYVREVAAQALRAKLANSEALLTKFGLEKSKLDDVMQRYEQTCLNEVNVTQNMIHEIDRILEHATHTMKNAQEAQSNIVTLEASLEELSHTFEQKVQESLRKPENCRGLRGYEDDGDPDGLLATYFPTPYFTLMGGRHQIRLDPVVDFVWNAREPAPGIPQESFSVRWDGYLRPPETGEYIISVETTCGARIYLNKRLILIDRMPEGPFVEYADAESSLQSEAVPLLPFSGDSGLRKSTSKPLTLSGGEKVLIRIEMIHSSHLLWNEPETAIIKLSWKGPHFAESVIPPRAFFSSSQQPFLKLSGLPAAWVDIAYLYPGIRPFIDSHQIFVGDISPELENSKLLKMRLAYQRDTATGKFEFDVNVPAKFMVAHPQGTLTPIENAGSHPVTFTKQQYYLSLYHAQDVHYRATDVTYMDIEGAVLPVSGSYSFTLHSTNDPYMLFLQALPAATAMCAGETLKVSDPTGHLFRRCTASSVKGPEYDCVYAFNQRHRDLPYGCWRTGSNINAVGQYIELFFTRQVRLTRFHFKPLDDPVTWPSEITLSFCADCRDKDQKFTMIYSSNLDLLMYQMAPVTTDYVRAEITQTYEAGQPSGGSFEFIGTECREEKVSIDQDTIEHAFAINECDATIMAISDFPHLRSGLAVSIDCPGTCYGQSISAQQGFNDHSPLSTAVFGTNIYSPDSAICYAAVHSGLCRAPIPSPNLAPGITVIGKTHDMETCLLTMRVIQGQSFYTGSTRNGIESKSHGPHELSIVFEPRNDNRNATPSFELRNQSKEIIILFHSASAQTPILPGEVFQDDGSVFKRKVKTAESRTVERSFGWLRPADNVICGETKTKGTIVPHVGTVENASSSEMNQVLGGSNDPIIAWLSHGGGMEFPHSSSSAECTTGEKDCSPNSWTIQLDPGLMFSATIQLGRPCGKKEGKYNYYLQVNGESVVDGLSLGGDEVHYATIAHRRIGPDGRLTLTGVCKGNAMALRDECERAVTTIMAVKITLGG